MQGGTMVRQLNSINLDGEEQEIEDNFENLKPLPLKKRLFFRP